LLHFPNGVAVAVETPDVERLCPISAVGPFALAFLVDASSWDAAAEIVGALRTAESQATGQQCAADVVDHLTENLPGLAEIQTYRVVVATLEPSNLSCSVFLAQSESSILPDGSLDVQQNVQELPYQDTYGGGPAPLMLGSFLRQLVDHGAVLPTNRGLLVAVWVVTSTFKVVRRMNPMGVKGGIAMATLTGAGTHVLSAAEANRLRDDLVLLDLKVRRDLSMLFSGGYE
jgi:hypothetical protein